MKTRREQIEKAAENHRHLGKKLSPNEQDIFVDAATWADANPSTDVKYGIGETLFKQRDKISILEQALAVAKEALEFYANPEHWTINWLEGSNGDYGSRSKEALDKIKEIMGETK